MSTPGLETREARLADCAAIARLLCQLGYEATPALIHEKLQSFADKPGDRVCVATMGGEVVGSISLHILPLFHAAGNLGRITSMVVDERHRGCGIGGALMATAERWFESGRCVKLEVTSGDQRPDAHRFYAHHGFVRDGQRFSRKMHP
ncbi:GCN5 family acetyltransferase [Burkholderia contaminans FFH2055]|uniref:GNAT family N-acetyltransferase n=1 Tax=Burkholderia contaminans TaxID=488447 RepID=UPI0006251988|nr:GNAT family N-acetyltransferase [Burkholderia contaminans]KKL38204.1 GCN5 family acetyltransferase [Burkholderia contaminans FFH2055]MEB4630705.1 GNAT family N-acetyltransferase [Burkholderia contaminans]MEB4639074.1 GNAT family N-acetyltransferase [Burkholderia contaminans]MEB4653730.1 GNAT family N-acetyltransferase [Burkholderia contaminans]MEB4658567.1 GNAT family N-acetyltransferase [Burkholderia contaminans]